MSHLKERKETNCLNCNAEIQGRYCHICGQENIEPKETAWHLISHFFTDITHFDGKFFSSLKYLVFRPGYLSRQYILGRRASYLNPVRMYVFTSAFFFLIFFSFYNTDEKIISQGTTINGKSLPQIDEMDSASFTSFTSNINKENGLTNTPMTREGFKRYIDSTLHSTGIHFTNAKYRSKQHYDSVLASGAKKHNWLERQLVYKQIELNEKYHNDQGSMFIAFRHSLLHSLPQMLFISIPIFALLLKLLYFRRKEFYYVSHSIFTIHLFIFVFIMMLVLFGLNKLNGYLHWGFISFLTVICYITLFFYEYKAMRNFYQQGRVKTILKFILLNIFFLIVTLILFTIFVFFSLFKL